MRIYNKIVIDMLDESLPTIYSEYEEYDGDIASCGGGKGGSSGGSYKISNEEKAILNTLNENMVFMKNLYRQEQLPYDLMVIEGNKELYPEYFSYNKSQLDDAQTDLALNRTVKDEVAAKQLDDIKRQGQLAQKEYESAMSRTDLYDQSEQRLANERLGMVSADIPGVMGQATSDVAQAYGTQKDALTREQGRLGVMPGAGITTEQNRLTGLDFAKTNALARQTARNAETTRVENTNLARTQANWGKDTAMLTGGRGAMTSAKEYSAMLNGGFGTMNGYQPNTGTPAGTDFAASMTNTANSAASGPSGVYVPGQKDNTLNSALGAASTIASAWMMSG